MPTVIGWLTGQAHALSSSSGTETATLGERAIVHSVVLGGDEVITLLGSMRNTV
jgi:hypothetical protein